MGDGVVGNVGDICSKHCCGCYRNHGTHVASTAAGRYGVAPKAEIRVVELPAGPSSSDILDGINWLAKEAQASGKPISINLSFGGLGGANDGKSDFDIAVSEALRGGSVSNPLLPGVSLAVSAGNWGVNKITLNHVYTSTGEVAHFNMQVNPYTPTTYNLVGISIWASATDSIQFMVISPSGQAFAFPAYRPSTGEGVGCFDQQQSSGHIQLCQGTDGNPDGTLQALYMNIMDQTGSGFESGLWRFAVRSELGASSNHRIDLTLNRATVVANFPDSDNSRSLNDLCVGPDTIAVAAYTTKYKWVGQTYNRNYDQNADGLNSYCDLNWDQTDNFTGCKPVERDITGELGSFSSRGPTRDGRSKPDIAAPGVGIVAAADSKFYSSTDFYSANMASAGWAAGNYVVMQGTSMASPHTAGAIAVLFQKQPKATSADALAALKATARKDANVAVQGPYGWGAGKMNVAAFAGNWWLVTKLISKASHPIFHSFTLCISITNSLNIASSLCSPFIIFIAICITLAICIALVIALTLGIGLTLDITHFICVALNFCLGSSIYFTYGICISVYLSFQATITLSISEPSHKVHNAWADFASSSRL
jgi:subtilisin family serine protease